MWFRCPESIMFSGYWSASLRRFSWTSVQWQKTKTRDHQIQTNKKNHVSTPFSSTPDLSLYFKGEHKKLKEGNSSRSVFRDATQLNNLSAPALNGSQKGTRAYKTSHTGKKSCSIQQLPCTPAPPTHSMTKWFSQLWCGPPLIYNVSVGWRLSREGGSEETNNIYNVVYSGRLAHRWRPSFNWCVVCIDFGVFKTPAGGRNKEGDSFYIWRSHKGGGGGGGGVRGSGCLFSRPLFESIVFRQLRFFMSRTIWRVLSESRAAAVFWGASFIDHRPGVGWWIQAHPPFFTPPPPLASLIPHPFPQSHPSHTMPDEGGNIRRVCHPGSVPRSKLNSYEVCEEFCIKDIK